MYSQPPCTCGLAGPAEYDDASDYIPASQNNSNQQLDADAVLHLLNYGVI